MRASSAATAGVIAENDPVWRAAMAAPIDDTPDTEEELAAIEEVKRSSFRSVSGPEMSAEIARRSHAT